MDPGLRLDDLAQRPQRDAVAVGEAATLAPGDEIGVFVDDAAELVDEAALADSGDADERHELRRSRVARAVERVAQDSELVLAADELGARLVRDVDSGPSPHLGRLPDRDRLGLPLSVDRRRLLVVDDRTRRSVRRLVGEDAVDRRGALKSSCRVHDVPRRHAFAFSRACIERDERLAGRDPDAKLEPVLEGEVADRERCPHGALGIVLVRDGSPEERHHRVPDELLDGAAVALELAADASVVRAQKRVDVLGIHRLRALREADEVAEDDRDDLALAARRARHAPESTTCAAGRRPSRLDSSLTGGAR